MRPSYLPLTLLLVGLGLCPSVARARSHHEQVDVKPITKAGKVIGAEVSMVLMNDDGYEEASVGLIKPADRASIQRPDTFVPAKAEVMSKVTPVKGKSVDELTLKILYGKGNKLKGGEHLDVVSGWRTNNGNPHVWGAVTGANRPAGHLGDIQLPEATAAKKKAAVAKKPIKRAVARRAKSKP
jgi:hypothetical protein